MEHEQTVLIFAGAGASKAVAPDKYPTTVEFFESLPDNITNNDLFQQVVAFLEEDSGDDPIDIELLLWRLAELKTFCRQLNDQNGLPGWMLADGRLSKAVLGNKINLNEILKLSRTANSRLDQLVSEINARVYDLYSQVPSDNEINKTWSPLLKSLGGLGARIEIVTTNYDMILEAALDNSNLVDIGWRGSVVRSLDTQLWVGTRTKQTRGLLTKLHGSVNWTRDGDQIFVSDPMFKGDHNTHVILYPGFKDRPADPTFMSFHNHFAVVLSEARVAIFLGFAFRDEFINDICERNTTGKTRVGIVNPERSLELPFTNTEAKHWTRGFDEKAVEEVVRYARDALGV